MPKIRVQQQDWKDHYIQQIVTLICFPTVWQHKCLIRFVFWVHDFDQTSHFNGLLPVYVQKLLVGSEFLQNDVGLISHLNGLSPVY